MISLLVLAVLVLQGTAAQEGGVTTPLLPTSLAIVTTQGVDEDSPVGWRFNLNVEGSRVWLGGSQEPAGNSPDGLEPIATIFEQAVRVEKSRSSMLDREYSLALLLGVQRNTTYGQVAQLAAFAKTRCEGCLLGLAVSLPDNKNGTVLLSIPRKPTPEAEGPDASVVVLRLSGTHACVSVGGRLEACTPMPDEPGKAELELLGAELASQTGATPCMMEELQVTAGPSISWQRVAAALVMIRGACLPRSLPETGSAPADPSPAPRRLARVVLLSPVGGATADVQAAAIAAAKTGGDCVMVPIYFEYDDSTLTPQGREVVQRNAECVLRTDRVVVVAGHTDPRGTEEYAMALGLRMAESVRRELMAAGVPETRIKTFSRGDSQMPCIDPDEACFASCRRVEMQLP
ncbi:MAG: OmpA family protein [Deltaproteobacteria bacterium]|nr:OmpA family protein [Deltaproteobacteria bacterium]